MEKNQLYNRSLKRKAIKKSREWHVPLGCGGAIALCGALIQMVRVMDFTAVQAYVNAFMKLLTK